MINRLVLLSSTLALGLAFSGPAMAATTGSQNTGNGNGSNIDNISKTLKSTVGDVTLTYNPNINEKYTKSVTVTKIIADQDLKSINVNKDMGPVVENEKGGYKSGANSVSGGAFAAFAGIQNIAWNTGVDSNAQAASNIAAQGNVRFGSNNPTPSTQ